MKKRTARAANKVQDATGQLSEVMQDATDGLREFGQQVQSGVSRVNRQLQSRISRVDESTIPDTFSNAPKLISPRVHAWLDLAVTGYFAILGTWCAWRGEQGAALDGYVNAVMVAGVFL